MERYSPREQAHLEGIGITPSGIPTRVIAWYDVDAWHDAERYRIAAEIAEIRRSLPLAVGLASREIPARLAPLVDALTMTLGRPECDPGLRSVVVVDDVEAASTLVAAAAEHSPRACLTLGPLLRQTAQLELLPALAAEAAVYSMLLSGPEFTSWLDRRGLQAPAPEPGHSLVRIERRDDKLSLVLDHPERRNAFSFRMREALFDALELALCDDDIKRVELSGAGSVFCSGGDLTEFGSAEDFVAAYLVRLDRAPWRLIDRLRDRVTIRVHGAAVGAGIEMAAFADHVVAEQGTFFRLPEIEMGLVPGAGGTVSVTRRVGRWRAAWMILSGAKIDTATALTWGLVDEVVEP